MCPPGLPPELDHVTLSVDEGVRYWPLVEKSKMRQPLGPASKVVSASVAAMQWENVQASASVVWAVNLMAFIVVWYDVA